MTTLTLIDPAEFRGQVYAATSLDGQWEYRQIGGSAVWSVTHAPTGRRYWTVGLDRARRETADGTAAAFLDIDKPLPDGKPLAKGEHRAIVAELSVRDCQEMLRVLRNEVPFMVESAAARVCPNAVPGVPVSARTLTQMLGVVYGGEPYAWVDALAEVRPDLVPPHLHRQPAAS